MTTLHSPSPDAFQSGAMVTDSNRKIIYANAYFSSELAWPLDKLIGKNSDDLFTHSSKIFCESYLMPLLIHEGKCEEMQLAVLNGNGERIPILINAKMDEDGNIYWSFFNASKRDKLYEEILNARNELEAQAKILKSMSSTDELTGLINRRALNERAPILIKQAKLYQNTLTVLIMDIDLFKKINDTYGHPEGDRVLRELGQHLGKFGRQTDLIARYGGEEFVLLLPKTNTTEALAITQRLHQLVSQIKVDNTEVTVSIGGTFSNGDQDFHQLTKQADEALYQAKNQGRNRTIFYQQS